VRNILVLGADGMLGSQLVDYFHNLKNYNLSYTSRREAQNHNVISFDIMKNNIEDLDNIKNFDYIINCIGIIKPLIDTNTINSIYINSIFPLKLANFCEKNNIKLIHITTDCVYSGKKGKYKEDDEHDCIDYYGKSKSLGEPKNCMVIRTSIIGKEKNNFLSLISWVLSQKNKSINGFKNHLWNGVTTNYLAEIIHNIIDQNLFVKNLVHIYSPNDVSKFELLNYINNKFSLNISINNVNADHPVDRTLRSMQNLSKNIVIKDIEKQINELI